MLSVVFGLLVGAIVMLVSGYDPIVGYAALWEGMVGNPQAIGETLRTMIPLVLAGLSVAFAFRTGLFNIGVEGQLLVGWLLLFGLDMQCRYQQFCIFRYLY